MNNYMRGKTIPRKTIDKHNDYVNKNIDNVLNSFSEKYSGYSVVDVFSILTDYLAKNLLSNDNLKIANNISREIKTNETLSKMFKKVGSAHLNGVILAFVGLSLMNLDKFVDEVINESIDNDDFASKDLEVLKNLNVNNISKSTLDRVNNYLVTGEKNIPLEDKGFKNHKCNCGRCTCNSDKKVEFNKIDREKAIKSLTEHISNLKNKEDKRNRNVLNISEEELFLIVLESLIR